MPVSRFSTVLNLNICIILKKIFLAYSTRYKTEFNFSNLKIFSQSRWSRQCTINQLARNIILWIWKSANIYSCFPISYIAVNLALSAHCRQNAFTYFCKKYLNTVSFKFFKSQWMKEYRVILNMITFSVYYWSLIHNSLLLSTFPC